MAIELVPWPPYPAWYPMAVVDVPWPDAAAPLPNANELLLVVVILVLPIDTIVFDPICEEDEIVVPLLNVRTLVYTFAKLVDVEPIAPYVFACGTRVKFRLL